MLLPGQNNPNGDASIQQFIVAPDGTLDVTGQPSFTSPVPEPVGMDTANIGGNNILFLVPNIDTTGYIPGQVLHITSP